ncbi:MAG: alpha-E domain-containing protein [Ilumatobacteraceae bacterium]
MTVLLARTADRLYWGARYVERAEDTARIVRAYHDLVVDFPSVDLLRWEPLAVLTGSVRLLLVPAEDPSGERTVVHHLVADGSNPSSIVSSVHAARENLRTTREVMPREAWQAVNQLSQYVDATASAAVERQLRDRFLLRVVEISRRLDGILESTMTRSEAYRMLRLGRLVERADMTTRVLGVAAAAILQEEAALGAEVQHDEIRWMNVLRSVSALQMYQRAVRGPIDGTDVVRFLVGHTAFPRSVRSCLEESRDVLVFMPTPGLGLGEVDGALDLLAGADSVITGAGLDAAMDGLQSAIAEVDRAIRDRYVDSAM